jgi:ABC-2 type transport system permease protein
MRVDRVLLVFRKDWLEVRRSWEVMTPILLIPLIFSIAIPSLLLLIPGSSTSGGIESLVKILPAATQAEISGYTPSQAVAYVTLTFLFLPFFLLIPAMASSVIASDSFAGEKERKTMEGLLATPITDGELLLGKTMVAFVPSMIVTVAAFVAYSVIIDVLGLPLFGYFIMPTINWILVIFLLAPAVAVTGIAVTVIVSARVKGFREAQQLSAMIVVPIMGLFIGQALGFLLLEPTVILILFAVFVVLDFIILRIGLRMFQREEILSRIK